MRALPRLLLLAALAVLAGCGGGGATTSTSTPAPALPQTPLAQALAPVLDTPIARAGVVYGDEAVLRRLAHAPSSVTRLGSTQLDQRWFGLVGFGAPAFVAAAPQLPGPTGIDLFAADRAVSVGVTPRTATRLDGARLDAAAIRQALGRLGARPEAGMLAIGGEGEAHVTGPLGGIGLVSALDRVVVRPALLAAGSYDAAVTAVLGGGRSIAADPRWRAAVSCLGDVVAASIAPRGGGLLALGVVRPVPHPAAVTERLCLVGAGDAAAVRSRLAARSQVRAVAVDTPPGAVRATVTLDPREPAGLLFKMQANRDLDRVLG